MEVQEVTAVVEHRAEEVRQAVPEHLPGFRRSSQQYSSDAACGQQFRKNIVG